MEKRDHLIRRVDSHSDIQGISSNILAPILKPEFLLFHIILWDILPEHSQFKNHKRASLVAQWLRIDLPMQGTRVRALVQEDPTCHGATKPCATTTEPAL